MHWSDYSHEIEEVIAVLKYAQNFKNKGDGNLNYHYIMLYLAVLKRSLNSVSYLFPLRS